MTTDTTSPIDESSNIIVAQKEDICTFTHGDHDVLMQLPLPGIVIFVHGVNSDGEWFDQAEKGLCAGLNARLARGDHQLEHRGAEAGQLFPAKYIAEIDEDGFLNPEMNARSFIQTNDTFSPVIRFRFGYKASGEELQEFGDGIYLNEENYWGGGPFANGCTTLPDLWGQGLSEELFLWLHVQHLNPTNDRKVFNCPPRPYYVLAAYRLPKSWSNRSARSRRMSRSRSSATARATWSAWRPPSSATAWPTPLTQPAAAGTAWPTATYSATRRTAW